MQYVRIPRERIGVLIGEEGKTRADIEARARTKISVEDTSISIEGNPLDEWITSDVVRAIGRGFSPEKALLLTNENMSFELVNLADALGDSEKVITRIKGRLIGTNGKSRQKIETLTKCFISVYGKTVGIIGSLDDAPDAREAVLKLISGSPHTNVFRSLERRRKERKIL